MAGIGGGGFNNPYGNAFGAMGMGATGMGAQGAGGAGASSVSPPTHKFKFAKIADVVNTGGDDDKKS
jgi:hypothetical protein